MDLSCSSVAEYAFKAIGNEGLASLGVRGEEAAVVVTQRKVVDKLHEPNSVTHLFAVTRYIGAVATGLLADSRALISRARQEASDFAYRYGYPIPLHMLARRVANLAQLSTQEAAMRPMGVGLTLVGIDEERGNPQVFRVDPAGFYASAVGAAFGPKAVDLQNALEKLLHSGEESAGAGAGAAGEKGVGSSRSLGATATETIDIALRTLATTLSVEFKAADVEIGLVTRNEPEFRVLSVEEVEAALTRLVEKD
jgi:20S proteasome subunit alpha 1